MNEPKTLNEARQSLWETEAKMNHLLELMGDQMAKENGWQSLDGIEACRYYLMQKHNWLPAQVRSMSMDDLRFALEKELSSRRPA